MFEGLKAADEVKALWSEFLLCEDTFVDEWPGLRFSRLNGGLGRFDADHIGKARSAQPFQKNAGAGADLESACALRERSNHRLQRRFVCICSEHSLFRAVIRCFRV